MPRSIRFSVDTERPFGRLEKNSFASSRSKALSNEKVRLLRRRSSISTSILAPASASYLHPRRLVVVVVVAAAATAVAAIVDGIWKAILPNILLTY